MTTARETGAVRIFFYNWPVYVATWSTALLVLFLVPRVAPAWSAWSALASTGAMGWSLASLIISYYIYDHSKLAGGTWIPALLGLPLTTWATIHAGLDAEVDVDAVLSGRCIARLDIFDAAVMTAPSIDRARQRTARAHEAITCPPAALALADQSCDAIIVAFTAHEIRDVTIREQFFAEISRALRPGGRFLLVEHLRDPMNFLAFGPGFLHFVARAEWLRLAAHAHLARTHEQRITPWVRAFTFERSP